MIKLDFLDKETLMKELEGEVEGISVLCECLVGDLKEWPEEIENVVLAHTTKNGKRIYAGGVHYDKNTKMVHFSVFQSFPKTLNLSSLGQNKIATTFVDLCWLTSDGTTNKSALQVETPKREDYEFGDLTWVLPQRFMDNLVLMIHALGEIISMNLQEIIVYGPEIEPIF